MKSHLRLAAASAIGTIFTLAVLGQSSPMTIRDDGLEFPDNTLQTTAAPTDTRQEFYLTFSAYSSTFAREACADGFHMASLWEIHDPSNLRYTDMHNPATRGDSGKGPPSGLTGWIRTGFGSNSGPSPGQANCAAWTSTVSDDLGTIVELESDWDGSSSAPEVHWLGPWNPDVQNCNVNQQVWCVED